MPDPDILSILANAGFAGILLILFLKGWLAPKPTIDRMAREIDRWRKLYEAERAAHDLTRQAHTERIEATALANAEAAQVAAALLAELQKRRDEANHT